MTRTDLLDSSSEPTVDLVEVHFRSVHPGFSWLGRVRLDRLEPHELPDNKLHQDRYLP